MRDLERALRRIRDDLDDLGRPWGLVGALAVAARAEARATLDVDVAVGVSGPDDAEALVEALRERGYEWKASFGRAMTSLAVPEGPPAGLRLDLLFSMVGIEESVARDAETMTVLPDLELPVARIGDLIALKLLGARQPGREHDHRDLRFLIQAAEPDDLDRARSSIATLARRQVVEPGVLERELERALSESKGDETR